MKKLLILLGIVLLLSTFSCTGNDTEPVDGSFYKWEYVKTRAKYQVITWAGNGTKDTYYFIKASYYGSQVYTLGGYFELYPMRFPSYKYVANGIRIGGQWTTKPLK